MSLSTFYEFLTNHLIDNIKEEILIHNKINNTNLEQPRNLKQTIDTLINLECSEIEIYSNQEGFVTLREYLSNEDDLSQCFIILKILISFYRLKNKLHLILGNLEIDYDIYIDSKKKVNWSSYMEDEFIFSDISPIYFSIKNPIYFHYRDIIYSANLKTNKYFFQVEDTDVFNLYNYILLHMKRGSLYEHLLTLNLFGEEHIANIRVNNDISDLLINKTKTRKDINNIFLSIFTFDASIPSNISVDRSDKVKSYSMSMNIDENLEELYNNSLEQVYNTIEIFNNVPHYIEYENFDSNNINKRYKLQDIISICLNAKNILNNYKRYYHLTSKNDIKLYKTIMKKFHSYNELLYKSVCVVYNQLYYYLINKHNISSLLMNYYLENIKSFNTIELVKDYFNNINIERNFVDNYAPTFTLQQIKLLFERKKEEIIFFIVKKMYNITESDKDYNTYSNIVSKVILSGKNDLDIYYNLIKYIVKTKKDFEGRGEVRVNQLSSLFNSSIFKTLSKDLRYLDYGGGDGEITAAIARHIKSSKLNSYIVDIEQWFGNIYDMKYADTLTYGTIRTYELPFEDNSLDFITCFQVLHHIKRYNDIIKEIYRVLKPGGLLVLREHDCRDEFDRMLIDVEHSIYETTLKQIDKINILKYLSEYEAYYKSRTEWNTLLKDIGLENITDKVNPKLAEAKTPARYYFDIYMK